MQHQTFEMRTHDGLPLFGQMWRPNGTPQCALCIIHGIGEHSSRYESWAHRFVDKAVAVVTYDQRGHGYSGGRRGVIPSYEILLNEIDMAIDKTHELFPGIPVVLYGHSMGGGEVINHVLRRKGRYDAVVATSPWLISNASPGKMVVRVARLLNHLVPSLVVSNGLKNSSLSHDTEHTQSYQKDHLVHSRVSMRLFVNSYDAGYWALNHASDLKKSILLLHGEDDRITSPKASALFANKAGSLCEFRLFPNAFHELHNEDSLIQDQVFRTVMGWMEKQGVWIPNKEICSQE